MEDKTLIKLCILSASIGLVLLIIISDKLEIPTANIASISKKDINKAIQIKGTIDEAINKGTISIAKIEDKTGKIEVILFKSSNLRLKKGSFVKIDGKVSLYNQKLQIIAEKVRIINE